MRIRRGGEVYFIGGDSLRIEAAAEGGAQSTEEGLSLTAL